MKNEQRSVLQDWVMNLGLRHQGALIAAARGADGVAKDDPIKLLTRSFRAAVLVSFDTKPSAFIDYVSIADVKERMTNVAKDTDSYNWHFLSHFLYASEIIGYHHPDGETRDAWNWFYHFVVKKMHLHPETREELDERLGMDEERFKHHEEPDVETFPPPSNGDSLAYWERNHEHQLEQRKRLGMIPSRQHEAKS